jgi:hypothetical protein
VRDLSRAEWIARAGEAGLTADTLQTFSVRLDFRSWVERMRTPEPFVRAIRDLQAAASTPVREHFAIEPDGSFRIEVCLFRFAKPKH